MEPLRPEVDHLVLQFVRSHSFAPKDFLLTDKDVCRLHPQMARDIVEQTLNGIMVKQVVTEIRKLLEEN